MMAMKILHTFEDVDESTHKFFPSLVLFESAFHVRLGKYLNSVRPIARDSVGGVDMTNTFLNVVAVPKSDDNQYK
jgi:hypothetical protein